MIPKFRCYVKETESYRDVSSINFLTKEVNVIYPFSGLNWAYSLDDVILEQSTGLFDMNGVEIFEGDVVKVYYEYDDTFEIGQVFFEKDQLKWVIGREYDWYVSGKDLFEKCEIIGNIHQNAELLKEE